MKRTTLAVTILVMVACISCKDEKSETPNTQTATPVLNQATGVVPVTAELNPAHGEPGHRCDIAVGAPLSGIPSTNLTSPAGNANITPTLPANINTQPSTQAVAAGMNPAHGQPGHRCDIAVGAPLK